jgi:UDP-N-acetylmuramoyl-tripeptide--D-alanyl-D-alanine ligase
MLASVLSIKYRVNKTIANYNNHIGVPLTILSTRNNHEILIAELGTNHFGEIRYTADICSPDFALVTNIGSSHLEFLKDKKGVLKEKGVLFDITAEQGGTLFVNYDDTLIRKYSQKFTNKITYGFSGDPDIKGIIKNYNGEGFPELEIKYKNRKLNITVPLPGEQSAFNFLAVCTAALKLGLKKEEIIEGLRKFKNISKRLNITKYRNFTLIDDTYNANPESMRYSLILLSKYGNKNKVAILGDMFELGADAAEHHKRLAKVIGKEKINEVYTIGGLMKSLFDELQDKKLKTRHFVDRQTLKNFLQEHSFTDSVVLVKGSRGMQMEEFVETLQVKKG